MEHILQQIKNSGIRINVSGANLKLDIPNDFKDETLLRDIKKYKFEILSYLEKSRNRKVKFEHIPQAKSTTGIKLTPSQLRIYVLQTLAKESTAYNMPFGLDIREALDISQLQLVFEKLIRRHDSLRTYFTLNPDGTPIQVVQNDFTFDLVHHKCKENELDALISDFTKPFNIENAPLIKASIIELDSNRFILLIDLHHVVFDGFSLQIFINDLKKLYKGENLDKLSLQYRDYAEWYYSEKYQNSLLSQKAFWQKELSGFTSKAVLPTDFEKIDTISFEGEQVNFKMDAVRAKVLFDLKQKTNVSIFTIFTALYSILQYKLTGEDDLVIGTPVAGRRHPDLEGIIGMFVNTIAMRLSPKNTLSFTDYLSHVGTKTISCFENQEYPYEDLIEDLGLRKGKEVNPLFNTLISLNSVQQNSLDNGEFDIKPYDLKIPTAKFDMVLHIDEDETGLCCSFEYKTKLFQRETMERFFTFLCNIIDQVGLNNNVSLGDISLLEKASADKLIELNDFSDIAYPTHHTLVQLFEDQVRKTPNYIALTIGTDFMTYEEVNKRSNQVARILRAKNVGPDVIVGLLMEKSFELIIGMLGILKAGGAYLPIDVTYPQSRIDYILDDSKIQTTLTSKKYKNILKTKDISCLYIEDFAETWDDGNLNLINSPEDLCYIIYTSGTTGNPKGVMVEHRNVSRLLFNEEFQFDFSDADVWTMFHSHCFDFSVWEMYGALLFGGNLVIVSQLEAGNPSRFVEILIYNKVTVLNQTPSSFYELIQESTKNNIVLDDLRYVIFGGEALTPGKLKSWKKDHPDVALINMYGITETTVHVTYKELGEEDLENYVSNIGRPISTNSLYILDDCRNIVPEGVIGEIYVGGKGVTRGYLNKEELTQSRFVLNPFRFEEKMYRSGDLARLLKNGELEYMGRADKQVQLNGFRIEVGEIEFNLGQHELITNAVVVLNQVKEERASLYAYFTSNVNVVIDDIRNFLGKRLPYYMIPSHFIKLEEIPLSSNNKVDYSKLPKLKSDNLDTTFVAPVTANEIILAEIWGEVLDVKNIGTKDDFFGRGGDSIKAIKIISETNKQLNTSLVIADIYSYPTIRGLILTLDSNNDTEREQLLKESSEELKLFQESYKERNKIIENFEEVYPMNGIELGMIFYTLKSLKEYAKDQEVIYHEQSLLDLPYKGFDFEMFKRAVKLMTDKHAGLRKIYDLENFAHIILKVVNPEINFVDISHLDKPSQDRFIKEEQYKRRQKRRDMSFSLLWQMLIIKISDSYQYLLFDFHHSLLDGWSLQTFITELNNTCLSLSENKDYLPKALEVSYKDQIFWELYESKKKSNAMYWKDKLEGYTRFELPKTGLKDERVLVGLDLGLDYRRRLLETAIRHNTSVKHLCFAAYIYLLRIYSYSNDIVSGIVTNNRPLAPDSDKLIGCFLNTIPCRIKIEDGITWGDYIDFVEMKLKELKYHERMPFNKILEVIGEKTTEQNPIFDVSFNYVNFWVLDDMQSTGQEILGNELDTNKNYMIDNIPFALHVNDYFDSFKLYFYYSTAVFTEKHGFRLSDEIKSILDKFMNNPTGILNKSHILSVEEELQEKLIKFNDTKVNYEKKNSILDLFKEQVSQLEDATAVSINDELLSYKELDAISNQLAHSLVKMGVSPGTLVPICVDRSLEMIIGIIGVLKAGGTYVPIDPSLPQDRISYIIKNTESSIVLTETKYAGHFEIPNLKLDEPSVYNDQSKFPPSIEIEKSSLAYVIYTSGSTGKPKGVMIDHEGIYNRLSWMRDYLNVTREDSILQKTNFSFDVSVWELLLPLICGAKLVFAKPDGHTDPNYLRALINERKISLIHFVPSMLSAFLKETKNDEVNGLRAVICSGETLPSVTVKQFQDKLSAVQLYNLYGPTEASIDVTAIDITNYKKANVPIGRPVANTQIYIVDSKNNIQPIGVKGELLIGGVQVARGYVNNLELTSEKFIENPFDNEDTHKVYRTGDFAKWLPDGNIEFLGRIDNQIKLRGNRIELGEIETCLGQHSKISAVAVDLKEISDDFYIVAYYVIKDNEELEEKDLKNYLRSFLPDYMIPSFVIKLNELPITINGKLNRKALPNPKVKKTVRYIAPESEEEMRMVEIWADILKIDSSEIGVTDNFFNLGGHSLKALELISKIWKMSFQNVTLRDIFAYPEIRTLITAINRKDSDNSSDTIKLDYNALKDFQKQNQYDVTFTQSKEFLRYHVIGRFAYNMVFPIYVSDMDVAIVKRAIMMFIDRHEILRTKYLFENGKVKQRIFENVNEQDFIKTLVSMKGENIEDRLRWEYENSSNQQFDFENDFLISIKIGKLSEESQGILVCIHHAISDARCAEIIQTEIRELYNSIINNRNSELKPLKFQAKEYAYLIKKMSNDSESSAFYKKSIVDSLSLNGTSYSELKKLKKNRYRNKLKTEIKKTQLIEGKELVEIPQAYGHLYNLIPKNNGGHYSFFLKPEELKKLEKISSDYGKSNFVVLLTLFALVNLELKSEKSTRTLIPFSQRITEELNDLIGWMVSEVLVVISISDEMSMKQLVNNVSETIVEASQHRFYHHERILNELNLDLNVLAPELVNYAIVDEEYNADLTSKHIKEKGVKTHFNHSVTFQHYLNCIRIDSVYKLDYLDNHQMEIFWQTFLEKVELLFENSDCLLSQLQKNEVF